MFFEKGTPTKDIWFFEHPYPDGYKSYSRSKPLTIKEFDLEKNWWNKRKTTEHAWKVSAKEIADKNYNLDCKNPYKVEENLGDPDDIMAEFLEISAKVKAVQDALKDELTKALERS